MTNQSLAILITSAAVIGLPIAYNFGTAGTTTITVEETFMMKGSNEPDTMLIRTTDGDLFMVDDSLLRWEFRSADLWSDMSAGETWEVEHFGWRLGFFSWFPQIYSGSQAPNPQAPGTL